MNVDTPHHLREDKIKVIFQHQITLTLIGL